jgi:hypothetical protein
VLGKLRIKLSSKTAILPTVVPLRLGIPFAKGTSLVNLKDFVVKSKAGALPQSSLVPIALWNEGSVQWACVDLLVNLDHSDPLLVVPKEKDNCNSEPNSDLAKIVPEFSQGNLSLRFSEPTSNTSQLPISVSVSLTGASGTTTLKFTPTANSAKQNELAVDFDAFATLKVQTLALPIEFQLSGRCWCTGQIDFSLRACNPNPADHPGGNWDLGNAGSLYFKDLSLKLEFAASQGVQSLFVREALSARSKTANRSLELFQASSGGQNWNSSNHLDRHRQVPMPFRGYRLCIDGTESTAERATPYVATQCDGITLAVACNRFWQNFPMAIRALGCQIEVGFLPRESGYEHEIQGGEQKTFQFAAYLGMASAASCPLDGYLSEPCPVIDREYLESTCVLGQGSLGRIEDESGLFYERLVNQAIDGPDSFFSKREKIDQYGWRHYGDLYGDHEAVFHKGPTPMISHYNNQYDCVLGFFYQFLRSGDPRWYEQMVAMADHAWDIDTYHTQGDKLLYNGGLFWHTYHYADADTGTHRSYPRSLLDEDHFESGKDLGAMGKTGEKLKKVYGKGGGPAAAHNYSTGWMHAYYLTGEIRYKQAAINAAEYVLRIEDGSKTPFRWLSNSPTGHSTCSSAGYYGPGRASANSTLALLNGYELTGEPKYIERAIGLMRSTVHPEQNLGKLDLLNAELRWFYTMYLQALCRLIDVLESNQRAKVLYRDDLCYAIGSLMHYARWMLANEHPILDHPEKLQYPTETWAAQEMRKWEVFAYAARWCASEEEGLAMMDKAEWFYDYVIRTLDGFETKSLCRPIVLLLNYGWQREGMLRAFREQGLRRVELSQQWPAMKELVPQKQIAVRRAKRIAVSVAVLSVLAIGCVFWWLISGYLRG